MPALSAAFRPHEHQFQPPHQLCFTSLLDCSRLVLLFITRALEGCLKLPSAFLSDYLMGAKRKESTTEQNDWEIP